MIAGMAAMLVLTARPAVAHPAGGREASGAKFLADNGIASIAELRRLSAQEIVAMKTRGFGRIDLEEFRRQTR